MSVVPLGGLVGAQRSPTPDAAEVRFVRMAELANLMAEAEERALLPVLVPPLRPADRGKLALVLEEAVENALERRGACPPGVGAATDLDSSLGDQLYRARLIEARGLCLFLASLEGAATLGGSLDAEDSAVLRFWLESARSRPVLVLLEESNRMLSVYGPPFPLAALIPGALSPTPESGQREASPLVAPELAASSEAMELSEPPPAVRIFPREAQVAPHEAHSAEPEKELDSGVFASEGEPPPSVPSLAGDVAEALVAELTAESGDFPAFVEAALDATYETPEVPSVFADEPPTAHDELPPASDEPSTARDGLSQAADAAPLEEPHARVEPAPIDAAVAEFVPTYVEPAPATHVEPAHVEPAHVEPVTHVEPAQVEPVPAALAHGPLHPAAANDWQNWVRDLENARGPKPLAVVERMFAMSYVPLRDAYLRGIAPSEVGPLLEGWAKSFANSYREAFDALRVRGKRPTMVLDVPDAALRIGRLHGARSVQLLLVDGLRFDLGLRVELGLRARLGREVALTERLLLWSALPSDTATQLELIGRGPEGLRDLVGSPESEIPVARGRMARTPRRIKAGHRELLKLDLVEARLSEPGGPESARLDALGAEVTDAVAELCEKLPQRTLLFVFGDHGFCLEPQGEGTGAMKQGGSRPEEVLVPAFAWLVGGVQ